MNMDRAERTRIKFGKGSRHDQIQWFAAAEQPALPVAEGYEEYIDALASAPRKVDVLLRFDGTPGAIQGNLLERLAHHPKVGRIIICGLPKTQRAQFAVLAAMLNISIRFCDDEDEAHVLLHKRRSRAISNLMLDAPAVSTKHH
jgi:hypothetical protein